MSAMSENHHLTRIPYRWEASTRSTAALYRSIRVWASFCVLDTFHRK